MVDAVVVFEVGVAKACAEGGRGLILLPDLFRQQLDEQCAEDVGAYAWMVE